jgi:hypothetical protein
MLRKGVAFIIPDIEATIFLINIGAEEEIE